MSTQPQPTSPLLVNAIFIGGLVIGIALVFYAVREIVNDGSLGESAVTVDARVTGTRIMTSTKRGDSYELRYAFDVGGRTYTYGDATGRTDLWGMVTSEAWAEARTKGTIAVVYLPADPAVNHAVAQANNRLFDHIAGLVMGLFCMAPAFLWLIAVIRRRGQTPA